MNQPAFTNVLRELMRWRDEVIGHLRCAPDDGAAMAKKLELDTAIKCLEFCEQNRISPALKVYSLAAPEDTYGEYRLMWDYETEDRSRWQELRVNGEPMRAIPGDLLLCQ